MATCRCGYAEEATHTEDVVLVERCQAGDCEAQAEFYREWRRFVLACIQQRLAPPDNQDDTVEEMASRVWLYLPTTGLRACTPPRAAGVR
jgi:hypothetical protein